MCIRDSHTGVLASDPLPAAWFSADLDSLAGTGACIRGIDPVSYTHLRAHETVLDLVCRLLLEKKHMARKFERKPVGLQFGLTH